MSPSAAGKTVLATLVIAVAVMVDLARAQEWSEPQRLSTDDAVSTPDLLFDPVGRGLAIWARTTNGIVPSGTRFAFMPPNGLAFRAERAGDAELTTGVGEMEGYDTGRIMRVERRLSCAGCRRPRTRLYLQYGRFYDGSLLAERLLRRAGRIESQSISVNGDADAVIAWSETRRGSRVHRVYARTRENGRVSRARRISPRGATDVETAISERDGDALVAWVRRGRVETRAFRDHGGWGRIRRVGRIDSRRPPSLALTAGGARALVAWRDVNPLCADGGCDQGEGNPVDVKAAWGALGRRFSDTLRLDRYTDLAGAGAAGSLQVAFGEGRTGYVAWSGVGPEGAYRARLARVKGERLLADHVLSAPGTSAALAGLAASRGALPHDRVAVAWVEPGSNHLFASTGEQGDAPPGPAQDVSGGDAVAFPAPSEVRLAFAPRSDRAVAVWRAGSGGIARGIHASIAR